MQINAIKVYDIDDFGCIITKYEHKNTPISSPNSGNSQRATKKRTQMRNKIMYNVGAGKKPASLRIC